MNGLRRAAFPAAALVALALGACAPTFGGPGPAVVPPEISEGAVTTPDGTRLPLREWLPDGEPKAVIVALHGFNDYGNFFDMPGKFLATQGIASVAYDQRGFGATATPGRWAGTEAMVADAATVADLVRARYPGKPLYMLGESMGGAVLLVAAASERPPACDGYILAAPAVWGRATMPWYQRWALWLGAHLMPWATVTGRGLDIRPSDNIEMLRALGRDPLVIKETRVSAVYGLVDLMDRALASGARFDKPALILYGEKDEIIPKRPTYLMLTVRPRDALKRQTVAIYAAGYHMLLRDLEAEIPWRDIAHWMEKPNAPLPSGADRVSIEALKGD